MLSIHSFPQIGDYWIIYLLSKNLNPVAMKELIEELKPVMNPTAKSIYPSPDDMGVDEKESPMWRVSEVKAENQKR